MHLYLDTANLDQIKHYAEAGFIDGVTTNPSLVAKEGKSPTDVTDHLLQITGLTPGLVSVEVYATNYEEMLKEAHQYTQIAENIVIKLPTTEDGLRACHTLSQDGIKTNLTLVFSPLQALLAAKMGATLVSPFVGRVEDALFDGLELIARIRQIYDNYNFETKILAASFRSTQQIAQVAEIGADVATVSPELMHKMTKHPLTDIGLEKFLADAGK